MTCFPLTLFFPLRIMKMTFFMSVIFSLNVHIGFGTELTVTCRPFCTGDDCISVNLHRGDFETAEKACHDMNGELVTFHSGTNENNLHILSQVLHGDYWIGRRLQAGACSNLSAPLGDYEGEPGSMQSNLNPPSSMLKDVVQACPQRCVSLSTDRKTTERLCSDTTDGYMCKTKHKDACKVQQLSNVFKSSVKCSDGPCEHECTDKSEGYECSCFKGYIPDSKNLHKCKLHCSEEKCPAVCEGKSEHVCLCPDGYIQSFKMCEDIDECTMQACDQNCSNTLGSFVCFCKAGFVLKDKVKCIKAPNSESFLTVTPITAGIGKPSVANNTLNGSSAAAGGFLWLWILLVIGVVVCIFVIRLYVIKRLKRREQNSIQSAVPVDNEC